MFQDDFLGFNGHFPGHPILPGIVQIMLTQYTVAQGLNAVITKIKKCKFAGQIKPKDHILLRVDETFFDNGNKYKATVYANDVLCTNVSFELSVKV